MKLERLQLQNFRCFDQLVVNFHPKLTVIVAENGAGKTAILDAVAVGFGRFLTKLPGVPGLTARETDLRIDQRERRAPFLMISWEASTRDGEKIVWAGGRKRDASVTAANVRKSIDPFFADLAGVGLKQIDAYALRLVHAETDGEAYFLPVVAYYGTNRAIRDEVQRRRGFKKQFTRFEALAGALQSDSRFRAAFEWFNAMEDLERREKESRRDFDFRLPELDAVRSAIVRMLPVGFSNPRTEVRPLRFVIDRLLPDGVTRTLRLSQLSDGFRVILGLVMDLARRMAQANSKFITGGNQIMNPLDLPAVVLIDEVDLHLHPKWQQTVLTDLMRVFSGTQFIVTTHSPQVLTTVESEHIRVLEGNQIHAAPPGTKGAEASRLLKTVLGVNSRPDDNEATKVLAEYLALVDADQWQSERARELRKILDQRYQGEEPALLEADLRIENRKWEMGA